MKRLNLSTVATLLFSVASTSFAQSGTSGVSADTILIGDVSAMSGPASFVGNSVALGSRIAAAEINAAGGIHGRRIRILTEDDANDPGRSFQAAKKLLDVDGVFAMNATSGSSSALAMLPLLNEQKVPLIVTTAPNEAIYAKGAPPTIFTLGADYSHAFYGQMKHIHQNLSKPGAKYALLRPDNALGDSIQKGYERAVKEFNLTSVATIFFKFPQREFSAELARLRSLGVNVIVSGAVFAAQAAILNEARKLGMNDLNVATIWTEITPIAVKLSGGANIPYTVADYVAAGSDKAAIAFREKARKFVGDDADKIDRYTIVTYVGLRTLAQAMEKCGRELTRACAVENLKKTKNLNVDGLVAPISFDNPQHLSATALKLYQFDPAAKSFKSLTDFQQY
jgi:branched-chain amino acid transport system substrate-binding protein